jgi:hypothetical protein
MNKELLCKDCKYSSADWLSRLLGTAYNFKCTVKESWEAEEFSPVTGVTRPGFFQNCGVMRATRICGPSALLWEPAKDKNLFLRIKHGR